MTVSSQSNIKEQEEQSKLSRHLIDEKIRTLILHTYKQSKVTVSEWNKHGINKNINYWNDHNDKSLDPGSATISIVPVLTLREIRHLAFTARQGAKRPSRHGLGGRGSGPFCTLFQKGVTASSNIIHGSTMRRDSCLDILLFIQIIFYMFRMIFDNPFLFMVHIVYLISLFIYLTILIYILCIFLYYHTWYDIVHLVSVFDHQIIVSSRLLLYTVCLFFVPVRSVCWSKNISAKYDWFTTICTYFLIYLFNLSFWSS